MCRRFGYLKDEKLVFRVVVIMEIETVGASSSIGVFVFLGGEAWEFDLGRPGIFIAMGCKDCLESVLGSTIELRGILADVTAVWSRLIDVRAGVRGGRRGWVD